MKFIVDGELAVTGKDGIYREGIILIALNKTMKAVKNMFDCAIQQLILHIVLPNTLTNAISIESKNQ